MEQTHRYGLIGRQLSHSFSQDYFSVKFLREGLEGYTYELIEMEELSGLRTYISKNRLDGFNVTIPYKVEILPLLDDLDDSARQIGAVNCVKVLRTSEGIKLKGFNTDAPAFAETLQHTSFDIKGTKALILGTGGAAQAVAYGLGMLGIEFLFVSRTPRGSGQTDYTTAYNLASDHQIIVNATPVGMFPICGCSPWAHPEVLTSRHLCYDLIYNPSPTRFMQEAALRGAAVQDGLPMLHRQAELSWNIWE